ncbi:putative signal transduction protein [Mizugakiibacter sediminis]|nr:HDOD domain-containing protein [Mizugakiibacter sediminis]GAP65233.1 putative signal transduction protein [Mizugakiibacter sediminis]
MPQPNAAPAAPAAPVMLVARQPILDREQKLLGYELLFRAQAEDREARITNRDAATARVLLHAFVDFGIKRLVGESLAFVNLTRNLLLNHQHLPSSGKQVGLEILEGQKFDAELVEAVRTLAGRGYTIVLDDFAFGDGGPALEALLGLAHMVKLDVLAHDAESLAATVQRLRRHPLKLVAEKVQTREQYERCLALGFDYFQGYYLLRPENVAEATLGESRINVMRLLAAIENPATGPDELDAVIRNDAVLSYKLLRLVNSAYFALPIKVKSILHAIVYLGLGRVRGWVRMLALAGLEDRPAELLKTALVRARMCEQLAARMSRERQEMAFTVGLFSLLDALMNAPMETLFDKLPLPEEVRAAVQRGEGPLAPLLDEALACERAEWDRLAEGGAHAERLAHAYLSAVEWAEQVYGFAGAQAAAA